MVRLPSAADIIARLELKPHPEGGHYRETFRDTSADADGRARSTAIYYLLSRGERSQLAVATAHTGSTRESACTRPHICWPPSAVTAYLSMTPWRTLSRLCLPKPSRPLSVAASF